MGTKGFEPNATTINLDSDLGNEPASSAAKSAAFPPGLPADLARVVEAWPRLPAAVRRRIVELAERGV
jgi:hypothetical protein